MHCIYTDRCYHKERWYSLELLHIICVLVFFVNLMLIVVSKPSNNSNSHRKSKPTKFQIIKIFINNVISLLLYKTRV